MDDSTIINEIIIDGSVSEEETKGNYILSFKGWESVTKMEGEHVKLSKDWSNLFGMKKEGVTICVLCFEYHNINKSQSRKQNSCFFQQGQYVNSIIVSINVWIRNDPLEYHTEDNIVVDYIDCQI